MSKLNSSLKTDIEKLPYRFQISFAIFCAEQVLHLVREQDVSVCLRAVQVAHLFLEGKTSQEECSAAAYAAANAANAANAAAYAAYAAAYAADKKELVEAQWSYYYELLNFDEIVEKAIFE